MREKSFVTQRRRPAGIPPDAEKRRFAATNEHHFHESEIMKLNHEEEIR